MHFTCLFLFYAWFATLLVFLPLILHRLLLTVATSSFDLEFLAFIPCLCGVGFGCVLLLDVDCMILSCQFIFFCEPVGAKAFCLVNV